MKINKSYISFVTMFVVFVFFVPILGMAQTAGGGATQQTGGSGTTSSSIINSSVLANSDLVATVNIYRAKLISQNDNTFNVSFDLSNRIGVQTGIKYSIYLSDSSGNTVDEKVYDDVVSIGENQRITKTAEYTPSFAVPTGKYTLMIRSESSGGLPLAIGTFGLVNITSNVSASSITILPDTCYLTIGTNTKTKYTLRQGVDIGDTESLTATCSVSSILKLTTSFTPLFETRVRDIFGVKADQTGGATSSISIKHGTSTISLVLPKALKPQAYDVLFNLTYNDGSVTSNTINFHYVLNGSSGTVQNVIFDKLSYVAGDTANLKILISDAADTFSGSRTGGTSISNKIVNISLISKDVVTCGSISKSLSANDSEYLTLSIPISVDCFNPTASVTFSTTGTDGTQQVLDSKTFTTPLQTQTPPLANSSMPTTVIVLISLILIAVIIFIYEKFHKKA